MLTQLSLEHFKCFGRLELPLKHLTLLAGFNASGKSSVLQAIVLLHQTMKEHEWSTRLQLNGTEIALGTIADVVDKVTGRHEFGIGLHDGQRTISWGFKGADRKDMSATISELKIAGKAADVSKALRFLLPTPTSAENQDLAERLCRVSYLTAERLGPREVYPLQDPASTQVIGSTGENAMSLLHWGRDLRVLDELALDGVPPSRLRQVEARMGEFFPGCSLELQEVPRASGVTLGLRTSDATDFHRPVHTGFGLTQVLPVVVAALSAQPRDILLIENPEVHLHPGGQAMMGRFLAQVAGAGIQVIMETHSDHVLNGLRRAVKDKTLSTDQVLIHFFKDRDSEGDQVVSPTIDENGNVDHWPDGFFDQFDKDMNHFAGWN